MIDHERARELAGARHDGELAPSRAVELDAHLADCAECRAFAAGLHRLTEFARTLPREPAPAGLSTRITARLPRRRRWPRLAWPLVPALTGAIVLALVLVASPDGTRTFEPPVVAAAAHLVDVGTLYVEREVVQTDVDAGREVDRMVERIWFRAPGFVRVERDTTNGRELEIYRPGVRYLALPNGVTHEVDTAPSADLLPEPLSPTVAMLGRPTGPGPVIAGRPTTRYELSFDSGESRTAYVDATTLTIGTDQTAVLGKQAIVGKESQVGRIRISKRVREIRYNEPILDERFCIPSDGPPMSAGFESVRIDSLRIRPHALPAGYTVARSGEGVGGQAYLLMRGASPVLVTEGGARGLLLEPPTRSEAVEMGGRIGTVTIGLYTLPGLTFTTRGQLVTLVAALPPAELAQLALSMYPE